MIEGLLRDFFNTENLESFFDKGAIIVSRPDGIPLVSYEVHEKGWTDSTLSALAAASWQAAENIIKVFGALDSSDYRFSFDTSSSGFYILKVDTEDDLVISYIYNGHDNPGKIKSQFRRLKIALEDYILENKVGGQKEDFLFDDISDDEMDQLFGSVVG
tara:strand:+ start:572 stop:1048 length:477 start_codon:yes stop_codon:yes gene_type:complete